MNAKELRKAADRVSKIADKEVLKTGLKCVTEHTVDMMLVAEHILATVREDDDDLVTYAWLSFIKKPYMENRKIRWNFDGYTVSISSSGAKFHCNHMPIASVQTRGQFRALCKGLGIELKECENETK